ADVNAGIAINCDAASNRAWGFNDSAFLGNTLINCHTDTNGRIASAIPTACTYSGNRYFVMAGQEAGASTNAPSGTTADNIWWGYMGAGGADSGIVPWVSGTTFREGGAYKSDNANANHVIIGCYAEGNQNPSQLTRPTIVISGQQGAGIEGTAGYLRMGNVAGLLEADAIGANFTSATSTFRSRIGEQGVPTALNISDTAAAPSSWRLRLNGNDLQFDYANSNNHRAFVITGPSTAQQFGAGTAVPHALYVPHLVVGDDAESIGNARRMMVGTAAPATGNHGAGEIMFNRAPASGQPMGWVCAAAGSPGTWLPLANVP
ncbi:MAG TPA: hypothetical protein VFO12_09285, partial [Sphingomicrobium sp.]|nr:hypothetical protein [Sphingomicrobium sp.]